MGIAVGVGVGFGMGLGVGGRVRQHRNHSRLGPSQLPEPLCTNAIRPDGLLKRSSSSSFRPPNSDGPSPSSLPRLVSDGEQHG